MKHMNLRDYSALKLETFELFEEGYKCTEIATILTLDRHTVGRWLRKAGYKYSKVNKTSINSSIFDTIDTEEKAYWLGFIFADGYVSKNTEFELSLSLKDFSHLEKFKKFLDYKGRIHVDNKLGRCRLQFGDPQIVNSLKEKGCVNKKSLILEFPTEDSVPLSLTSHFIRGYFDGDGSISGGGKAIVVSIIGTFQFLNRIHYFTNLESFRLIKRDKRDIPLVFQTELCGDNARKFCNYIYKDSTIYLQRKHIRYLNCLENYVNWNKGRITVEIYDTLSNINYKFEDCQSACKYMKCTWLTLNKCRNSNKLIQKKYKVLKYGSRYKKPKTEGTC